MGSFRKCGNESGFNRIEERREEMSVSEGGTYFYLEDWQRLGSDAEILTISLYKGMQMSIHGHEGMFNVVDWNYHHGHGDEEAGLRIILKENKKSTMKVTNFPR